MSLKIMLFTCSSNGQGRCNGLVIRIVLHMLALLKTILFIIMSILEYGNLSITQQIAIIYVHWA